MPLNPKPETNTNWQERRRGTRLNSHVRVAVEWEDGAGNTTRAEGYTRVVNPTGCLVILPHELPLEQRVRLTNLDLAESEAAVAVVVWKGKETPDGFEVGFEFDHSPFDFWGLEI